TDDGGGVRARAGGGGGDGGGAGVGGGDAEPAVADGAVDDRQHGRGLRGVPGGGGGRGAGRGVGRGRLARVRRDAAGAGGGVRVDGDGVWAPGAVEPPGAVVAGADGGHRGAGERAGGAERVGAG